MSDIVTRLRNWRDVHLARLHLLMDEAADEMERLSGSGDCPTPDNAANRDNTPATHDTPSEGREHRGCTLTDEEREAVEWYAAYGAGAYAATLRGLLSRTGQNSRQTGDNAAKCTDQEGKTPERDHQND